MSEAHGNEAEGAAPGLRQQARALLDTWRDMADARMGIAALEVRRAGEALSLMLVLSTLAASVVSALWLLLVMLGVWGLTTLGWRVPTAIGIAVATNLALVTVLALRIRALARRLTFEHTRRALDRRQP